LAGALLVNCSRSAGAIHPENRSRFAGSKGCSPSRSDVHIAAAVAVDLVARGCPPQDGLPAAGRPARRRRACPPQDGLPAAGGPARRGGQSCLCASVFRSAAVPSPRLPLPLIL